MLNRPPSPPPPIRASPGTRWLAILLCLALLLGAKPVIVAHAATHTVTSNNDIVDLDGCDAFHCSLREAIADASSGDTIVFSLTLPNTIELDDQLTIDKSLTITGPGITSLTIDGDDDNRVFWIPDGDYDVTITGLTIAKGGDVPRGGGMFNQSTGEVVLENVLFRGNKAYFGGGMYNLYSDPALTEVNFINNWALFRGGGMCNHASSPTLTDVTFILNRARYYGDGGGMYNNNASSPRLTDVTFAYNWARDGNGGGMYNNNASSPTLINVTFYRNLAINGDGGGNGGGMYNTSGSSPTLTDVTFEDNYSFYDGGGMYNVESSPALTNVEFISNNAGESDLDGNGGGMCNTSGSNLTLTNVTFEDNDAFDDGGGMYNVGSSPSLTNVTFSKNEAKHGGGMHNNDINSNLTITDVTFSENQATDGGGMYNVGSSPSLTNVTFSGNTAVIDGGGVYNEDSSPTLTNVTISGNSANYGGGINNYGDSNPTLTNVTISGNSAGIDGGGMYTSVTANTPTLRNTILAGNSAVTSGPDCHGPIISGDYNLIGKDAGCTFTPGSNDQVGTATAPIDPRLRPLANNGGETQTRALRPTSPAINRIPHYANGCGTTVASDQRGAERPYPADGACDIGAFEYVPPAELPDTGFAPGRITRLPAQPAEKSYTALGDLWLEVPGLGVQAPIVSVPAVGDSWDVSWLGNNVGYLQGSAFPTWQGNTVLTAHVWDAYNQPGLFIDLKQLSYGDRVVIHAWGLEYLYQVRESRLISPDAVNTVMQHKELDWVTLFTCENYRYAGDEYALRRMVQAVLVEVSTDP